MDEKMDGKKVSQLVCRAVNNLAYHYEMAGRNKAAISIMLDAAADSYEEAVLNLFH